MNNVLPDISVVLPVYNGLPYLKESVSSVLNQQFKNFEFIILDDCSTDGSWEYLQSITDSRVKLMRNDKNKGLFPNLNIMIIQSAAPLIKLWAQDDIMYPSCLETIVAFHKNHPEVTFSYTGRDYIDDTGKITARHENDPTPEIVDKLLHAKIAFYTGSIAGNIANVTIRKNTFDKVGLFNEKMKISGDFEMWVRLSLQGPVGFIKPNVIQLRNHTGQLSRKEEYYYYHMKEDIEAYHILLNNINTTQQKEGRKLLRRHKLLFYYTLMLKCFLKGRFSAGMLFLKALSNFDNIFIITVQYIRSKLFGKQKFEHTALHT